MPPHSAHSAEKTQLRFADSIIPHDHDFFNRIQKPTALTSDKGEHAGYSWAAAPPLYRKVFHFIIIFTLPVRIVEFFSNGYKMIFGRFELMISNLRNNDWWFWGFVLCADPNFRFLPHIFSLFAITYYLPEYGAVGK